MASKARQLIQDLQFLKANPNPTGLAFDPSYRLMGETGKYSPLVKPSKVSFHVLRQLSRANAIVRLCVDTLKHKVSRQSWAIMPIDEEAKPEAYQEQIDYVTKLLKKPNPNNETFRTLTEKTIEDILVLDQADWELIRNPKGEICEIYSLDGATIRPVYNKFGQYQDPAYLQYLPANYNLSNPDAAFSMSELIHMMQNPQTDTWHFGYGMSPVEAVILAATNFLNADIYQGEVFTKGNLSQIMISLGKNAQPAQVKQFREFLITQMQGQNYSVPVIGGSDDPKVLPLAPSQKDAQYMEYVQWEARVIVGAFGLSPQDIGLNLDQYKAEGEVQAELSAAKGYASLLDLLAEYINQELIWEGLGETNPAYKELQFVWTNTDKVNEKERADVAKIDIEMGAKTVNEYRLGQGLDPLPGGDRAFIMTGSGPVFLDQIEEVQQQQLDMQQQAIDAKNKPADKVGTNVNNNDTTQKSLSGKSPAADMEVAFIDKDKVPHAFGKEVSFIASGDRVPRDMYQAAKAKFYEAAQLSYGYLNPRDIQNRVGLIPVELSGNLKEAQNRITSLIENDADGIYGVVTHFQKFGAETQPLYGVYYVNKATLGIDESYEFQKGIRSYVKPVDRLIEQYANILNKQIKELYPRLKSMIDITKSMDDLATRANDYDSEDDGELLIKPTTQTKSYYVDAIAVALALGAQNLITKAKSGRQRERIAHVVERFTPDSLSSFVDQRSLEAAKSVAMTLKDGATKLIGGMAEEGKSTDEIASALKEFLGFEDGWRAKRIARTELNFAASRAANEQAMKAGAQQKAWFKHTSAPEDECNKNERAGWIGIEDSYPSGAMSTSDSHVNCSCSEEFKFENE